MARDRVCVEVRAVDFLMLGRPLPGARISVLGEPRAVAVTNRFGRATLEREVGEELTLVLQKEGVAPTQAASVEVSPVGLSGPDREITFQAVPNWFLGLAKRWLRVATGEGRHHVVATVTAAGKTLDDLVQGEAGATVALFAEGREVEVVPIYLGIVPVLHVTDFVRARWRPLVATSADGGVIFPNVEPGSYSMRVTHPTRTFSECKFVVRDDSPEFVNASPPLGPRVIA
jgi:hypothetical protein